MALDDDTIIFKGEAKDKLLDEALAMALETECKSLYPDTPIERMYDDYLSYDFMNTAFEMTGTFSLCSFIKDKEGRGLRGAKLVQYVFSLHGTEISPEQADAFVPFLYQETLANVGGGTDDEPDNQFDIDVKNLFESQDFWENIKAMYDYYTAIEPHLLQELDKLYDLHPDIKEGNWVTLNDLKALLFVYKDFPGEELEPFFEKCRHGNPRQVYRQRKMPLVYFYYKHFEYIYAAVKAAKQAVSKELEPIKEEPLRQRQHIPNVTSLAIRSIGYPTDKVNCHLWGNLRIGKQTILKAESDRDRARGKRADIIVMLNFEELDGVKISRPLTIYDKRVFIAVANLVNEGQYILTPTMIDKAMGATTKTAKTDKEKILESLAALVRARVTIDNTTEAKLYGYERIKGDFPLLAASIVTAYVDGQLTEGALQVAELPKLFQFSINRDQVTTIPIKLLESPISKTKANMTLEDYLIRRISQMNNPNKKVPNKILLSTLYDQCGITDRKQRSRLIKEKLPTLLDHYVKTEYIKSYTLDDKSITIISPTKG